jgi:hypothetical protein
MLPRETQLAELTMFATFLLWYFMSLDVMMPHFGTLVHQCRHYRVLWHVSGQLRSWKSVNVPARLPSVLRHGPSAA